MSSRSLAAARSKRAGDQIPPMSGTRPVTSIGSQAAFAQQMPSNMPPPPSNVRVARPMQQHPPSTRQNPPQQYQQFYEQQPQQNNNGLPFNKLSISDAIGLITLRLGRVEQWLIDFENDTEHKEQSLSEGYNVPDNHKIIDNAVLTSIVSRLDSLEKNGTNSSIEEVKKSIEEIRDQIKRMGDQVSKHTIELAKNTEEVFRFNRELTETKDILKSFMIKYDLFAQETTQNFSDYENALAELEKRLPIETEELLNELPLSEENSTVVVNDIENDNIMSVDLKNMIKSELANI